MAATTITAETKLWVLPQPLNTSVRQLQTISTRVKLLVKVYARRCG